MRDFGFGRRQEKFESEFIDEMSLFLDILKNGPIYDGEKVRPVYKVYKNLNEKNKKKKQKDSIIYRKY